MGRRASIEGDLYLLVYRSCFLLLTRWLLELRYMDCRFPGWERQR